MEPSLNPLMLHKPLLSRYFPATESTFTLDGLFSGLYTLYIVGDSISATAINAEASANSEAVFVTADRPTGLLQGQVLWADTGEPVPNAVVSRSWYPWELNPSDLSITLDRFAVETDADGTFKFDNLTEKSYQLSIRAVHAELETATKRYQRTHIHKQVEIPILGTAYRIYFRETRWHTLPKTMKNSTRVLSAILIINIFLILQTEANAVIWEDSFEQEVNADWQHTGNDSTWQVEDGFLKAEIHAQMEWRTIFELYEFIAYPGPYNNFTITLETVGATHTRFGIALAKHFLNIATGVDEYGYYLFFTNDIQASRAGGIFVGPGNGGTQMYSNRWCCALKAVGFNWRLTGNRASISETRTLIRLTVSPSSSQDLSQKM